MKIDFNFQATEFVVRHISLEKDSTELAYCLPVSLETFQDRIYIEEGMYFPKSQVKISKKYHQVTEVFVPEWLVQEKMDEAIRILGDKIPRYCKSSEDLKLIIGVA